MADCYNSKIAGIIGRLNGKPNGFAITISSTCTLYSVSMDKVDANWRQHEDIHKAQIRVRGWFNFMVKYLVRLKNEGYQNSSFEREARGEK